MTTKDYLYQQFKNNIVVTLKEIYFHCGCESDKEEFEVRAIIRNEMRVSHHDLIPTVFKVRRGVDICCMYLE